MHLIEIQISMQCIRGMLISSFIHKKNQTLDECHIKCLWAKNRGLCTRIIIGRLIWLLGLIQTVIGHFLQHP
jgi:hypothetical protein